MQVLSEATVVSCSRLVTTYKCFKNKYIFFNYCFGFISCKVYAPDDDDKNGARILKVNQTIALHLIPPLVCVLTIRTLLWLRKHATIGQFLFSFAPIPHVIRKTQMRTSLSSGVS